MWHDMDPYYSLDKLYIFYMAAIDSIISRCGLRIEACCKNQINKSKPLLYNPLLSRKQSFKTVVHM